MSKNASGLIDGLIANLDDWRGLVLANIRRIIYDVDPEIIEEWKWMGAPVWSHDGIICVASVLKDKVKLTFSHGAYLEDLDKIFNNGLNGKEWRAIDIFKDDRIDERSFKTLIRSAIAYNQAKLKSTNKPNARRGSSEKKLAE